MILAARPRKPDDLRVRADAIEIGANERTDGWRRDHRTTAKGAGARWLDRYGAEEGAGVRWLSPCSAAICGFDRVRRHPRLLTVLDGDP
ncbi:hypothetical protein [Nonomuraea jabiensis]|uniref:hypothetical protein n=1 Tax=Nonomuraea jabiensis TaxID=882448 RepID=UPI003D73ECDE